MNAENVTYFDSFVVAHIPKEIRKLIRNKNITMNIYSTQAYDSIMCGYFCFGFIDFMLKGNSLLDNTNLFFNGAIAYFPADNYNSVLLKSITKTAGRIGNDGTKNVKIRVPLKYLNNFGEFFKCS